MKNKTFLLIAILLLLGPSTYGNEQNVPKIEPETGKVFLYTAKKLGVPILKASIKIENGFWEAGKSYYRIQAQVDSLPNLRLLFRMKNRFTSIVETSTYTPIRYIKEIDQGGPFVKDKHYHQTLFFDLARQKVTIEKEEKGEMTEKKEIPVSHDTYDPLSLFARYYLKEEVRPGQDIQMSIFDGVKLRQIVFRSKKEKVELNKERAVETVCLECTTPFSTFGDQEGSIRIWYTANREKIPIVMELDLPIGSVKFELEEIRESKEVVQTSSKE
ncbi:MAG: DUF3108 domain-containing protein [Deltaproteobacteria bacterium]|nr:DUF3108 domain-containing protein [Deltaproteobacteria bacterium]